MGEPEAVRPATFDLASLVRFADLAVAALGAAREEIDALNVYPVPDGDTGTNLFMTVESAREALRDAVPREVLASAERGRPLTSEEAAAMRAGLSAFARGALLGARGNSGVILSQLLGACLKRVAETGPDDRSAGVFADGLSQAAEAAYAAVGEPVEGTILTVARAAADAAALAADAPGNRLGAVVHAAAGAAREALARTPDQLKVLRDAGVVDAGGRGLCVLLDAVETAVTGHRPVVEPAGLSRHVIPSPVVSDDLTPGGPSYEVMYLLDADDAAVPDLRRRLAPLGDSLVVVGGDGLWNVHVHVDDVGAAVEAGIAAGRPHRIRVTHFAEQVAGAEGRAVAGRRGRAVVAVSAGTGLADLFEQAGAHVVAGGPGRRPSTGEVRAAVLDTGAAEVVVLPNDRDSVAVAELAARSAEEESDLRVVVVPTTAQVHGLAALAVHEPARAFDEDVLQMTAAARHARSGAVTVAVKQAMTTAGRCEAGDALGVIEGDFVLVGKDLVDVATGVLDRLLGGGGELVTVVEGAEAGSLADRCSEYLAVHHPTVDVVRYVGGQERYPLLIGVE